jgi:hypothetical protein
MKREGLFNIIKSINDCYGQDIAILSCEELNKNHSGNYIKLVKEYMETPPYIMKRSTPNQTIKEILDKNLVQKNQKNFLIILKKELKLLILKLQRKID